MEYTVVSVIEKLIEFWRTKNANLLTTYDMEIGAATFSPFCFFHVLSQKNKNIMYLQPCRRKADGRYGLSPARLSTHHQFQVIIQPSCNNILETFFDSLEYI